MYSIPGIIYYIIDQYILLLHKRLEHIAYNVRSAVLYIITGQLATVDLL